MALSVWLTILLIIFSLIILYFKKVYQFWEHRKVPFLPPTIPLGNSKYLINKSGTIGIDSKEYYDKLKKQGHNFGGIYFVLRPALIIVNLDYVRDILSKDFHYFTNRGFYYNEKDDPITAHLFALDGSKWKNLRIKLTPTFTSGKMKMMFETILQCSLNMLQAMDTQCLKNEEINILEMLASFTTDVIGACAFGINCNSFKYPDAEFRKMGKRMFEPDLLSVIRGFFIFNMPQLSRKFGLKFSKKDVSKFFHSVVEKTVTKREEENVRRSDFLQLLIDLKNNPNKESALTMQQIVSQVFLFFIAGFDTSSTTMNFALYELAKNENIQDTLRQEINDVLKNFNNKITYESLAEMKYLAQIIDETLRLYPPVPSLTRICVENYKLRDTNIIIEKGTQVIISTMGIHRDPEYYPNPEQFDPDRFSFENKHTRHPFAHIPFGEGPRNCIGLRFGLMQSKIGIINVIRNYKIKLGSSMNEPLHLDPRVFLLKSLETLYLKFEKI